jgi:serine phosphatase RsbU (regulator of sigma subunit)
MASPGTGDPTDVEGRSSDGAASLIGGVLATLWLAVLVVLDLATAGATVVLAPLFALAPIIACAVLPARTTAIFAVAAIIATVASGWWNDTWDDVQQIVRLVDVLLVSTVAVVVAAVRVRREKRFARVVVIAEVAQRAILPTLPSVVGQVAIGARYLSAAQDAVVGGDLYDCYHSTSQMRVMVGDVRGKGIGAVEQAARVIRAFRQSAATEPTLPGVAQDMTAYLEPFFDDEEFVTALLVDGSDPESLRLVSCGHPPALIVRANGSATLVEAPAGLPLGLGETYDGLTVPWGPGDRLLIYTDGLSEARNASGEFLSLLDLAPLLKTATIDEALDDLLAAVRRHVPKGDLTDDLAVILLENVAVAPQKQPGAEASEPTEAPVVS